MKSLSIFSLIFLILIQNIFTLHLRRNHRLKKDKEKKNETELTEIMDHLRENMENVKRGIKKAINLLNGNDYKKEENKSEEKKEDNKSEEKKEEQIEVPETGIPFDQEEIFGEEAEELFNQLTAEQKTMAPPTFA